MHHRPAPVYSGRGLGGRKTMSFYIAVKEQAKLIQENNPSLSWDECYDLAWNDCWDRVNDANDEEVTDFEDDTVN